MNIEIKTDCKEFHGRSCGIIKQENKFLIMRVDKAPYLHIPCGHTEIGEDSNQTVTREIKEEIGCDIKGANLFAIKEKFLGKGNKTCHGIEFYYIIKLRDELEIKDYETMENDKGKEKILEFKWITLEELKTIDLRSSNIRDMIVNGDYLKGLTRIINKNKYNYREKDE